MIEDRFMLLFIHKDIVLDYETIIKNFVSKNACKMLLANTLEKRIE